MAVHPVSTRIVTTQPGIVGSSLHMKNNMWQSSIFSCCDDMGICCFGFWCPPCLACQVSSDFGECLCMPLVDMMSGGMVPAFSMALRSSMRERFHLQGSMCDDCCIAACCNSCSYCQMARELKRRKGLLLHTTTTTVELTSNPPPHAPAYMCPPTQPMPAAIYPPIPQNS